jgi:hypothetical protein
MLLLLFKFGKARQVGLTGLTSIIRSLLVSLVEGAEVAVINVFVGKDIGDEFQG